jgi:hypothetical protein
MRVLIAIILLIVVACKNESGTQKPQHVARTVAWTDSFQLDKQKVYLQVFADEKRDRFQLTCKNDNFTYLEVMLKQPPGEVKAENIFGDTLPEIVVDDCVGCDLGRLRLFFFNRGKQRYTELKGTDSLLSEIYPLNEADLIYNVACFNQGGCESTLLKVVGDSCMSLAKMYVPYSEEPIELTKSTIGSANVLLPRPKNLSTDSLIAFLWKERFMKKSQQPTAAFKNKD